MSAPAITDEALLYGHDPSARIVALHLAPGRPERMRLYRRLESDEVVHEDVPFHPFFFLTDVSLLKGFSRDRFQFQTLDGEGFFRTLAVFPDRSAYWDAIRHIERVTGTEKKRPDEVYTIGSPEQQYLMQTGRTLFKSMSFDDLHRIQIDIEVAAEGTFPNAEVPEHAIIIVSMTDNRDWSCVLDTRSCTEEELLRQTVQTVLDRNPDVLEGHNIYGFDLPYLMTRCKLHGVPFRLGRDGSIPRTFPSSMRFAERSIEFEGVEIAGRHVVDTLFQAMSFDVFKRDLPNYTLKGVAKYFGFAPEGRTYIEGHDIARTWREEPDRLLDYALDDVIETERIARHLSGSTFYLTQMVPMAYGQAARTGPAAKIESLFVRAYLHARHSLPKASWGSQVVGGYTDVFVTGVVGPIVYADVESLYPSIMLNYDVQPSGDALGIFPRLLRTLTQLRLDTKAQMADASSQDVRGELDARQSAFKIVINCFTPDTEVLTPDGLKRIGELRIGDPVFALNPATLQAEIKPVVEVMAHTVNGDLVHIENRFADFQVTPNHRFLTARFRPGGHYAEYGWETADDLLRDKVRRKLPPLCPLPGSKPTPASILLSDTCDRLGIDYQLGERGIKEERRQGRWQPNRLRLEDWLALLGWYISEGTLYVSTRKEYETTVRGVGYRVTLCQKNDEGRRDIEALLTRIGIAYGPELNGLTFSSKVYAEIFEAECGRGSYEKRIPSWVYSLDADVLTALFDALMAGDGDKNGMRYSTVSKRLADDVVRLCYHLGRRAYIMGCDDGCYRIAINDPDSTTARGLAPTLKASHRSRVPYDGMVHCVTVADHHTLLAGRNGKLNWCGQSFYGNLGFGMALFNDFAEADRVASIGQDLLRQIIGLIRQDGGRVIEVDTDGVLFIPPSGVEGEAQERAFVDALTAKMPEGIRIGFDGRYKAMMSYKKKNYALLGYDDRIKFKGSSLVSRSVEQFGRRFVRQAIRLLLDEDIAGLHALYLTVRDRVIAHDWEGVEDFQRVETLKASLKRYERDVADGKRTRTAAYELARQRQAETGQRARKGDRIAYYIARSESGARGFEAARFASEWDPADPDENTPYYLDRLDQFARKFEPFFASPHDFRLVFSPEDLFGFDPSGIKLKVTEADRDDAESPLPF